MPATSLAELRQPALEMLSPPGKDPLSSPPGKARRAANGPRARGAGALFGVVWGYQV